MPLHTLLLQEHLPQHLRRGKGSVAPKSKKRKASAAAELDAIVAAAIAEGNVLAGRAKDDAMAGVANEVTGDVTPEAQAQAGQKPQDPPQPSATPALRGGRGRPGRWRGRPALKAAEARVPAATAVGAPDAMQSLAAPDGVLSSGSAARLLEGGKEHPFARPCGAAGSAAGASAASAAPAVTLEAEAAASRTAPSAARA